MNMKNELGETPRPLVAQWREDAKRDILHMEEAEAKRLWVTGAEFRARADQRLADANELESWLVSAAAPATPPGSTTGNLSTMGIGPWAVPNHVTPPGETAAPQDGLDLALIKEILNRPWNRGLAVTSDARKLIAEIECLRSRLSGAASQEPK